VSDKEVEEVDDDVVMANPFSDSNLMILILILMKNKKINEYIELLKCRR
jgi:hypothetical protein